MRSRMSDLVAILNFRASLFCYGLRSEHLGLAKFGDNRVTRKNVVSDSMVPTLYWNLTVAHVV